MYVQMVGLRCIEARRVRGMGKARCYDVTIIRRTRDALKKRQPPSRSCIVEPCPIFSFHTERVGAAFCPYDESSKSMPIAKLCNLLVSRILIL